MIFSRVVLAAAIGAATLMPVASSARVLPISYGHDYSTQSIEKDLIRRQNEAKHLTGDDYQKQALWPVYFCGPDCNGYLRAP